MPKGTGIKNKPSNQYYCKECGEYHYKKDNPCPKSKSKKNE